MPDAPDHPLPPCRIEARHLVTVSAEAIVFRQERQTLHPRPERHQRVLWVNLVALGAMLSLMGLALGRPGAPASLVGWGAALLAIGLAGYARWQWLAGRWQREAAAVRPGVYAVRFDAASHLATLIGPLSPDALPASATAPVAGELALDRVSIRQQQGPPGVQSETDTASGATEAWSACLEVAEPPAPDWAGSFDLFDGIPPDLRWYVLADNPEARRRHQAAAALVS